MEEVVLSLEQILAAISPQKRYMLERKITDDCHLADIAKSLTNWKSVCAKLGINEVEEEEIQADNPRLDGQKYVRLYCTVVTGLSSNITVSRMSCKLQVRELLRPLATRSFYYSFYYFYSGWHCCANGGQKMVPVPHTNALPCVFTVLRDQIWWR